MDAKIVSTGKASGCMLFRSPISRATAILDMIAWCGFNYFVPFLDVDQEYSNGLSYGFAHWVEEGQVWIDGSAHEVGFVKVGRLA